ncbi:MarR family winged helix-turn-helix transcriptional regulator [Sphingobium chungangianum]
MTFQREQSVGHLVNWAARLFARRIDRRLRPLGISSGQIPVLLSLAEVPGISQKAIVERASVEQPAVAAMLMRMEKSGLVARAPSPDDGRASLFSLTSRGEAVMSRLYAELDGGNRAALGGLSEEEKTVLIAMLQRVIRNIIEGD